MKLVERVAIALFRAEGFSLEQDASFERRKHFETQARVALEAMREFTPEMEDAATEAVTLLEGKEARWAWEAIIDAALME